MSNKKNAGKKNTPAKPKKPRITRSKNNTPAEKKQKAIEENFFQENAGVHRSDQAAAPAPVKDPKAVHRSDSSFNTASAQAPAAASPQPLQPAEDNPQPLTTFTPVTPPDTHRAG